MIFGSIQGQVLAVAAELDLAEALADGPRSLDELAASTGTERQALRRIMRALVTFGIFAGNEHSGYECTEAGLLLRRDHDYSLHHYALMNNRDWLMRVIPGLSASAASGRDSFESVHGVPCYDYLVRNRGEGRIFNAALSELSRQDALALASVCDFASLRSLVDVGGGEGLLIQRLLDKHPQLRATLLDLPEVTAGAVGALQDYVAGGRCEIIGADFRDGVPTGADCYVLKRVVSTCPVDDIEIVLQHIAGAMAPGGRLLIADPDPDSPYGTLMDVLMLVATGGALRQVQEIAELLQAAGLRVERTFSTPTTLQVVEAGLA